MLASIVFVLVLDGLVNYERGREGERERGREGGVLQIGPLTKMTATVAAGVDVMVAMPIHCVYIYQG